MKTPMKFAAAIFALFAGAGIHAQTLQDAIRFTENEQYDKAKSAFRQLIVKEPTTGDNFFYFGDLMLKTEDPDSARVLFQKGVDINATNPLTHVGLARYYMYTGKVAEGQKEIAYARSLVSTQAGKKGTAEMPNTRQAMILLEIAETYTWATQPDPDAAIQLTNDAEKIDPKNPNIFLQRGDALWKKDQVNASAPITNYQQAAKLDPKSSIAYFRIGSVYASGQNMPLAISFFNKALSVDPTFAPAYRARGEAQYQIAKFDSASISYQKYLELNNDCYSRYRYSAFLYKSGDYDNAIKQGQMVLACDSSITVVYRIIGRSYAEMKTPDPVQAVTYMNLFFAKQKIYGKPKVSPDDYVIRGRAYSKNNLDSLAVLDYKNAITVDTSRKDIYFDFATSYFKMKKYDSAAVYYRKKIDASTKPAAGDWYALGQALYRQKDYANADSAFKKVTELDPKNPSGWVWRGRMNAQLDPQDVSKKGLARPYYEMYIELAGVDKEKNKKDLIVAAGYLASYHHFTMKNYACSKAYYQYMQELDPANEAATTALTKDKDVKAATAADINTCKLPAATENK
jgi:tetratricopeptide (TPR) repeat protein